MTKEGNDAHSVVSYALNDSVVPLRENGGAVNMLLVPEYRIALF